jgi:GNAT superfamily N-acetyltransferase
VTDDRTPAITVVPLTLDFWPGLAALFGQPGDPKWCWCMFWRQSSSVGAKKTSAERRSELEALAAGDLPPGVVALDGEWVVGWCSIGPRTDFERLQRSRTIPRLDDRPVWAIVCFVVGKASRGRGLTRQLLDGAVALAAAHGAPAIEAYPADPGGTRMTAAYAYTGMLQTFLAAGFKVVAPTRSKTGGRPRVVVRKELG